MSIQATNDSPLVIEVIFYEVNNSFIKGKNSIKKHVHIVFYVSRLNIISGTVDNIKFPLDVSSNSSENRLSDVIEFLKGKGLSGRIRKRFLGEDESISPIPIAIAADEENKFNKIIGNIGGVL